MGLTYVEPTIQQNYAIPNVNGNVLASNAVTNAGNTQVIAADPQRRSITFHNPNSANSLLVSPTQDANGNALNPSFAAPGGGYLIYPGGFLPLTGDIQGAWQAIASAGTTNGMTVSSSRNA